MDTETKGTGAQMVPLDQVERKDEPRREKMWVPPKKRERAPEPPPPRAPRRFRVVEVVTRRVLAEDVLAREMLHVLGGVAHMQDVTVYVREDDRWRLLSLAEQEQVWKRRTPS